MCNETITRETETETWTHETETETYSQARIQEFLVEGDKMDQKMGTGMEAAVGPQRGPGAEPLVRIKGQSPL
jgi:hypothetical protein